MEVRRDGIKRVVREVRKRRVRENMLGREGGKGEGSLDYYIAATKREGVARRVLKTG